MSTTINNVDIDSIAFSVALQADGKIVAAGTYETPEDTTQFAVARFIGGESAVTTNCFASTLMQKYGSMLAK